MVSKIANNKELGLSFIKVAYGIFLTYSLVGQIEIFNMPLKYLTFVAIGILVFNFFVQYSSAPLGSVVGYIALMAVSLIHSYHSDDFGFFKLMLFAGSMRCINLKSIIKFDLYLRIILISLIVLLCNIGIATDVVIEYEGMVRHSLGFTNPNTLGIAVFVLVCDIFYVSELKLNLALLTIISAIVIWLYAVARSRTSVYAILAIMFFSIMYRVFKKFFKTKFAKLLYFAVPLIASGITYIVVDSYARHQQFATDVNEFLSGRVSAIAIFTNLLTPTFWGQPIGETLDRTLDNTYAFVLYDLGILVSILFIIFYFKTVRSNFKYGNIPLIITLIAFLIFGLSEHLWINVDYNVFMLAFCYDPSLDDSINRKPYESVLVDDNVSKKYI